MMRKTERIIIKALTVYSIYNDFFQGIPGRRDSGVGEARMRFSNIMAESQKMEKEISWITNPAMTATFANVGCPSTERVEELPWTTKDKTSPQTKVLVKRETRMIESCSPPTRRIRRPKVM